MQGRPAVPDHSLSTCDCRRSSLGKAIRTRVRGITHRSARAVDGSSPPDESSVRNKTLSGPPASVKCLQGSTNQSLRTCAACAQSCNAPGCAAVAHSSCTHNRLLLRSRQAHSFISLCPHCPDSAPPQTTDRHTRALPTNTCKHNRQKWPRHTKPKQLAWKPRCWPRTPGSFDKTAQGISSLAVHLQARCASTRDACPHPKTTHEHACQRSAAVPKHCLKNH